MKTKVNWHGPADVASEFADQLDEFANRVRKGEIAVLSLSCSRDRDMAGNFSDFSTRVLEIEYLNKGAA